MLLGKDISTLPHCLTVERMLRVKLNMVTQLFTVHGHLDVANLLLDRGANVESRTDTGETPFQLAKNQGIRDLLVERGAQDD